MTEDTLILEPDRKAVEDKLAEARNRYERFPNQWHRLEQIGRCLRWLGDPGAADCFLRVAGNMQFRPGNPGDQTRIGNLYRLAGFLEAARENFEHAHALYAEKVYRDKPDRLTIEHMLPVSFLTERDEEVIQLIPKVQAKSQAKNLIVYPIAKLSEARLTQNAQKAAEAVVEIIAMIRRQRHQIWDTMGVLPWDWYEIGLATYQRSGYINKKSA